MKRQIIKIDEEKCTGCGLCIPNCPEGALQMIEGKARVVNESMCDGLGACIGHCPEGAITIEEREAKPYDERQAMAEIVKQGKAVVAAHLRHLHGHGQMQYLNQALAYLKEYQIECDVPSEKLGGHHDGNLQAGCPGSMILDRRSDAGNSDDVKPEDIQSELRQWPVQLTLLNPHAPYFKNADIVLAADCVPFAYAGFHQQFLKGKTLVVFCPKLDKDLDIYLEKLTMIFRDNDVRSVNVVRMQVPCCFGMTQITKKALTQSGRDIPLVEVIISLDGKILETKR